VGLAIYLGIDPQIREIARWIAPSTGLAVAFAGTITLPGSIFRHRDAIDTLVFLRDGYARCEKRPDPELLALLNDRFQKLI
jgi:hypothetical protein